MKTPDEIRDKVATHLANTWHRSITNPQDTSWPRSWTILPERTTNRQVANSLVNYAAMTRQWNTYAASHPGLIVVPKTWAAHGRQTLTQRVVVTDLDTAVTIADDRQCSTGDWRTQLRTARARERHLASLAAHLDDATRAGILRTTISYSDTDFMLLCDTARWFATHHEQARGLTPRQVPVLGVHAKWLNAHHYLVAQLAGIDDLGLAANHSPRIHFTYLDPVYRSTGQRLHDSYTVGDTIVLAYQPNVVIISENKDTAIGFPAIPQAVAIEGNGKEGPSRLPHINWIADCPNVIYWGDIDVDGFTIVDAYRRAGLAVRTILMDADSYHEYAPFGTNYYPNGTLISTGGPTLVHLTDNETVAYLRVTAPDSHPRRIEQERIPLHVARHEVEFCVTESLGSHASDSS
ncbi:Wadjet anti-phage system protein JetD domain-containing protein [Rhodococcus sp. USK13]|uniref:Wadjet anti-phage system protein JetD domain-containing protein n=1 Tax=Rhodococcus sp. USK13 TaxID=2806442 RepID=UPI001BCB1A17|nr:Wadjet anti-phage system protein JetD domain-containing protein [Rhodococcus sp. USK13]